MTPATECAHEKIASSARPTKAAQRSSPFNVGSSNAIAAQLLARYAIRRRQVAVLLRLNPCHDTPGRRREDAEQVEADPAERFERAGDDTRDFEHNADEYPSARSAIVPPCLLGVPALLVGNPVGEIDLATLIEVERADLARFLSLIWCASGSPAPNQIDLKVLQQRVGLAK